MTDRAAAGGWPRRVVIGVTGNIACGKSTVMAMLGQRGAELIDADRVYYDLIEPGMPLNRALRAAFGETIASPDGRIDRRALGAIVFGDPAALARLDALTHPAVVAAIRERIARSRSAVVAIDAVKLIESGLHRFVDRVWLVRCQPDSQRARLIARNGIGQAEADRRIAAQPSLAAKIPLADAIIDNDGTESALRERVDRVWSASIVPLLAIP